ncbi:MAG: glycerol-3-phosphate dehydrogenase [Pseudomonadota bacterium]
MATEPEYDLAVIGAGVNGAGIARDAALRGLKVVLIDKGDIASGTSWISSRLIHGGLRYLEYGEIPLVYESLHERRYLRRIAAHLVAPLRITIPIYAAGRRPRWMIRLGMLAYDLLSFTKSMPRHDMPSREEMLEALPGLESEGLKGGARYYDAQVTFAERLVLENALDAERAGATLLTYHEVTGLETDANRVTGVEVHDTIETSRRTIGVKTVVNAAGPWVDQVMQRAASGARRLVGGTKGSHIIVAPFAGAVSEAMYVEAAADGRPIFILPWNGLYLIGTTDIRYDGSLDDVRASRAEIDYLLDETNRVFPGAGLTIDDVCYTYSGVRPLPNQEQGPTSAITRRHMIIRDETVAENLLSIVGGKLTTYRHLAEEAVDAVAGLLGRGLPACRTADAPLPGALSDSMPSAPASLSAAGGERLASIYGARAADITALSNRQPDLDRTIDADGRVCAAEVVFVIREERPRTLADILFRRTMLGLDADQGRPLYPAIADIAAAELGWSDERRRAECAALDRYSDSLLPPAGDQTSSTNSSLPRPGK